MVECEDCHDSASQENHAFTAGCVGCCARAAARSDPYRETQRTGRQTWGYRLLLQQFGLTHQQVQQAAASDWLQQNGRQA